MIKLELFEPADFQQLIDWIDSEELLIKWSGTLFSFPLTMSSMEWYIKDSNIPQKSDRQESAGYWLVNHLNNAGAPARK